MGLLALAHEKPLSNTPGIASVGEKKEKKPRPIRWCRLASHVTKRNTHALPTVVAACMITVKDSEIYIDAADPNSGYARYADDSTLSTWVRQR